MIRSSKHILKYQTNLKTNYLEQIFQDYKICLQYYIDLIWNEELHLRKFVSTKDLPIYSNIERSQWRSIIYKNASEIIRSNKMKHKTSKPEIKDVTVNLDINLFNLHCDSKEFDEFILIRTPYLYHNGDRNRDLAITIKVPIKYHRHSLKYKDWNRKKTIKLKKINDNFYIVFTYEKEPMLIKTTGNPLGIDCGYKKLIATSDGQFIGQDLENLYLKISQKKQGSKNFNQLLTERDKLINQHCNSLDIENINKIVVEDLKPVKSSSKGKIRKKFMNKLQRWSYVKTISKLERLSEENGILFQRVDPAYTSQFCSRCGTIDKKNRNGESYQCSCGLDMDADWNAAINILHRGDYNPSVQENLNINDCKITK